MSTEAEPAPTAADGSDGDELTLEELDADGALLEGIAAVYGSSRADFLRGAAVGSAALFVGLADPPPASAAAKTDLRILNFDLVFEFLQSSFYLRAVRDRTVARMRPEKQRWAHVLGQHEIAHVEILKSVLGRRAVKKPFFNFRGVTESEEAFTRTAVAMEDLTVGLLAGQAPRFADRNLIAAVFSLLTTEARHAAWARRLAGFQPVANAFDEPKTLNEVGRVVQSTRFIAARPRTNQRRRPRYTG
ncbi:MAG: ferritin-like domain-containing protein [Actinomycetota bacterium]|nr:ferritin-like domain-containing protein [Actinomycetota bacterium]